MASRKQVAAAKRNLAKARKARGSGGGGRKRGRPKKS